MNPVHRRFERLAIVRTTPTIATGFRLAYDGRTHVLGNAAGTWEIRCELEQLGAGEIIGVGSIATALDAPHGGLNAEVIVSGRLAPDGVAALVLTPYAAAARTAVLVTVRLGGEEQHDPIVTEVLEVRGLPA